MLHQLRFVIAGLVIILVNQAVTFAVSAAVPTALRPAGSTRYALVQNETQRDIGLPFTWESTGLSTSVTIPAGKTADVMVFFCGVANPGGNYINVRAKIGSQLLLPNFGGDGLDFATGSTAAESHCVNFHKTNVSEGTKTVKIDWLAGDTNPKLFSRSMIVILNIH